MTTFGARSFDELGIQKVLPDVSFIAQYRDKIEAVFITHGHEDHIGAMPWVIPALDPRTPVYTGGFTMELVKRRMLEYNLWDDKRFITVNRGDKYVLLPHPMS
jgi:mRNA degradation ribonuclease J1/J2